RASNLQGASYAPNHLIHLRPDVPGPAARQLRAASLPFCAFPTAHSARCRCFTSVRSCGIRSRAKADLTGVFMSWLYVFLSIALDVSGTLCLKLSNGLSRGVPTALMFLCYTLSLAPLALAARH